MLLYIGLDMSGPKVRRFVMGHSRFKAYTIKKCKAPVAKYSGVLLQLHL